MYARVVRFEDGDADEIRANVADINERAGSGPPEGVPAKGLLMLTDPENGMVLTVSLFDSEEDRRQGDETLNAMNPPSGIMGQRRAVELYEVVIDLRA